LIGVAAGGIGFIGKDIEVAVEKAGGLVEKSRKGRRSQRRGQ
jgi:hypothetical protein